MLKEKEEAWRLFKNYHYLDHEINKAARMFIGYVDNKPAAFTSIIAQPGKIKNLFRFHRSVVIPDFQGLGLSNIINEYAGNMYLNDGKKLSAITTHPGLIYVRNRSNKWIFKNLQKLGEVLKQYPGSKKVRVINKRFKATFNYVGDNNEKNNNK